MYKYMGINRRAGVVIGLAGDFTGIKATLLNKTDDRKGRMQ